MFVIDGTSGTGKTTLWNIANDQMPFVSAIRKGKSRQKREAIEPDTYFVNEDEIMKYDFKQFVRNGYWYGFNKKNIDEAFSKTSCALIILRHNRIYNDLVESLKLTRIITILITCELFIVRSRLKNKNDLISVEERLKRDSEIKPMLEDYDHVLNNNNETNLLKMEFTSICNYYQKH